MKVLHIAPYISPKRGGISQAVLELIQALRAQNLDAELITTNDHGETELEVPLNQWSDYESVPTRFFQRFSPKIRGIREFQFSWSMTKWLWQHLDDYDLVHVHAMFCYPCTFGMSFARYKQIPYVNQPHGLLCQWCLEQSAQKKQLYLSLIERSNLNHSHALHLTSAKEQTELQPLGLTVPSFLSPLGLSIAQPIPQARRKLRQHLQIPEDQPIVLFMARLHPTKGLNYLIPAVARLLANHPNGFKFILAGSGDPHSELEVKHLLEQAGITEQVYCPGFVAGEFKNLLLQGSDLFVLPSYSESFSVAVLEAMAAGLTTIVTPGVALASVLKSHHLGLICEQTTDAIAQTIQETLNQPELRQTLGSRAREYVLQHYTWDQIAKNLIQTYGQLVSTSRVEPMKSLILR